MFLKMFLCCCSDVCSVTTVKPETVSIYQVKKTEKDTYKKRTNWRLKDLKLLDGRDEANVRNKTTFWLLANRTYIVLYTTLSFL